MRAALILLQEGISSMSLRVKFDLLHDEQPQVGGGHAVKSRRL